MLYSKVLVLEISEIYATKLFNDFWQATVDKVYLRAGSSSKTQLLLKRDKRNALLKDVIACFVGV